MQMPEPILMTPAEIHEYGIQIVRDYLVNEKYLIEKINTAIAVNPQIVACRDGQVLFILVRTACYPNKAELEAQLHDWVTDQAARQMATPYFAAVAICNASGITEQERATPVKGASFYIAFDGLVLIARSDRVHAIRLPVVDDPVKLEACRAYARSINLRDLAYLEPWLADDFVSQSQLTEEDIVGKTTFMKYLSKKLQLWTRPDCSMRAEIAFTNAFGAGPCVILTQSYPEPTAWTYLIEMKDGKICSTCMCVIPSPDECTRTGEIPV
jgi:hypothetical protein